jgi:hypothetical protein
MLISRAIFKVIVKKAKQKDRKRNQKRVGCLVSSAGHKKLFIVRHIHLQRETHMIREGSHSDLRGVLQIENVKLVVISRRKQQNLIHS